jgi:hypothetical protein
MYVELSGAGELPVEVRTGEHITIAGTISAPTDQSEAGLSLDAADQLFVLRVDSSGIMPSG